MDFPRHFDHQSHLSSIQSGISTKKTTHESAFFSMHQCRETEGRKEVTGSHSPFRVEEAAGLESLVKHGDVREVSPVRYLGEGVSEQQHNKNEEYAVPRLHKDETLAGEASSSVVEEEDDIEPARKKAKVECGETACDKYQCESNEMSKDSAVILDLSKPKKAVKQKLDHVSEDKPLDPPIGPTKRSAYYGYTGAADLLVDHRRSRLEGDTAENICSTYTSNGVRQSYGCFVDRSWDKQFQVTEECLSFNQNYKKRKRDEALLKELIDDAKSLFPDASEELDRYVKEVSRGGEELKLSDIINRHKTHWLSSHSWSSGLSTNNSSRDDRRIVGLNDSQRDKLKLILMRSKPGDFGIDEYKWSSASVKELIQLQFSVVYQESSVKKLVHRMGLKFADINDIGRLK